MIRTRKQLVARLSAGHTVALLTEFAGSPKPRWAIADTNEAVYRSAVNNAASCGELSPLAYDICGEPMQYGPVA